MAMIKAARHELVCTGAGLSCPGRVTPSVSGGCTLETEFFPEVVLQVWSLVLVVSTSKSSRNADL